MIAFQKVHDSKVNELFNSKYFFKKKTNNAYQWCLPVKDNQQ